MGDREMKYYSSYARQLVGRRWRRPAARGFRLSPTRLSVRRLRARLWTLLGLMGRCVRRNVRLLTRGLVAASSSGAVAGGGSSPASTGGGRRVLALALWGAAQDGVRAAAGRRARAAAPAGGNDGGGASSGNRAPRRPPCARSNSFYARAVAECLEFIKGSNVAAPPAAGDVRH